MENPHKILKLFNTLVPECREGRAPSKRRKLNRPPSHRFNTDESPEVRNQLKQKIEQARKSSTAERGLRAAFSPCSAVHGARIFASANTRETSCTTADGVLAIKENKEDFKPIKLAASNSRAD